MHAATSTTPEGEAMGRVGLFFRPNSLFNSAFEVPIASGVGHTEYDLGFVSLVAVRQLVNLAPYFKEPIRSGTY